MTRKEIGKKTRFEVFKRDGFTCQYCGNHPPAVVLHVDHIHPVAEGGTNDQDNLITSCEACNLGKGARLLSSVPVSLASKAETLREREDQLSGYQDLMAEKARREEIEAWDVAEILWPSVIDTRQCVARDLLSIKNFIRRLGFYEVKELAEIAYTRKPYGGTAMFKYFCGCCWTRIRDLNEGA